MTAVLLLLERGYETQIETEEKNGKPPLKKKKDR
jgi:hypothetical protein